MEKYGPDEEAVRNALDSDQGWPGMLTLYGKKATRA
jgi:hypothetical protein